MSVEQVTLPAQALLQTQTAPHDYRDCFALDIALQADLERYVAAFYTSWLFKLERVLLRLAGHPSTDTQALELAQGSRSAFAVWTLQARQPDQLLLWDVTGATCSWLMATPHGSGTRLYFGSGVRAKPGGTQGAGVLPPGYKALMGLHVWYSRALLSCAGRRLSQQKS